MTIELLDKEYEMIDDVNELTLKQYKRFLNIISEEKNDIEMTIEIISLMTDINRDILYNEVSIDSINMLSDYIKDLFNSELVLYKNDFFVLNDKEFKLKDLNKLKVSEFIDLEEMCKDPFENMSTIFAIIFDNSEIDLEHRISLFDKELKIGTVYGTLAFFLSGENQK